MTLTAAPVLGLTVVVTLNSRNACSSRVCMTLFNIVLMLEVLLRIFSKASSCLPVTLHRLSSTCRHGLLNEKGPRLVASTSSRLGSDNRGTEWCQVGAREEGIAEEGMFGMLAKYQCCIL